MLNIFLILLVQHNLKPFKLDSVRKRIVVDIGSGDTKAGFAGENEPLTAFQTVVGRRENGVH